MACNISTDQDHACPWQKWNSNSCLSELSCNRDPRYQKCSLQPFIGKTVGNSLIPELRLHSALGRWRQQWCNEKMWRWMSLEEEVGSSIPMSGRSESCHVWVEKSEAKVKIQWWLKPWEAQGSHCWKLMLVGKLYSKERYTEIPSKPE